MRTFLIVITFFILACSSAKKTTQTEVDKKAQISEIAKDSIFLYFERTLCYGECPAFKITVYSDGRSHYQGDKFVEMIEKSKN
jgi:thioredoxin-related protein